MVIHTVYAFYHGIRLFCKILLEDAYKKKENEWNPEN